MVSPYLAVTEAMHLMLFRLPRPPVSDMSLKHVPTPSDQRKDLSLRRTGETPVCVGDCSCYPQVKTFFLEKKKLVIFHLTVESVL